MIVFDEKIMKLKYEKTFSHLSKKFVKIPIRNFGIVWFLFMPETFGA